MNRGESLSMRAEVYKIEETGDWHFQFCVQDFIILMVNNHDPRVVKSVAQVGLGHILYQQVEPMLDRGMCISNCKMCHGLGYLDVTPGNEHQVKDGRNPPCPSCRGGA